MEIKIVKKRLMDGSPVWDVYLRQKDDVVLLSARDEASARILQMSIANSIRTNSLETVSETESEEEQ